MIHRIYNEWRKVLRLSATFLLAIFVLIACKKQIHTLGSSGIDEASLLAAGAIDTFSLETYSIFNDSFVTQNTGINLLGEMNDPVFGNVNAKFYTQLRLNAVSPNFGDTADIRMDSVVLAMVFSSYTGDFTKQTFEVYELNDAIDTAATYYEFSELNPKPKNLMDPAVGPLRPDPIASAIVDTVEVAPQLRLKLDTTFAKHMMGESTNNPTTYASNDNFLNYFKGLHIKTNNASLANGTGGVFGFNMSSSDSKMTVYYHRLEEVASVPTWVKKSYDFVISSASQNFNNVKITRGASANNGGKVQSALDNKANGMSEFYTQAFGIAGAVSIPGLSNIPKTAVIQKAILYLPIQYQTGSVFSPGTIVDFFQKTSEESNAVNFIYRSIAVSDFSKSVTHDIGAYVQEVVSGLTPNRPIYIYPSRYNTSANRIIFNGPNTMNKAKPKLYIIYTLF